MTKKEYVAKARRLHYREGELEIDQNAKVSKADDSEGGAYVQAWIWIEDDPKEDE